MSKEKKALMIEFRDDPDLFVMVNQYRINLGWTWKRLFLMGFANVVDKNGDNPDLIVRVANYLSEKR